MKNAPVLFIIIILATSCAVKPPLSINPAAINNQENGILLGSFSRVNGSPRFYRYTIWFRDSLGNKKEITIIPERITKVKYPNDFDDGKVSGSLFAFTLPKGLYEFYSYYNVYQVTTSNFRTYSPENDFKVSFEVKAGKINYIGEIRFYPELKTGSPFPKWWPFTHLREGGTYYFHNSAGRDIKLFKEKFPELDFDEIENITPQVFYIPALKKGNVY